MSRKLHLVGAAMTVTVLLAGCNFSVGGSASTEAPDVSRSFAATGFTGVDLAGSDDVVVRQGAAFSVEATGPQKVLDQLEIDVENGVLVVRRKSQMMHWNNGKGATITVTLPKLDRAEVSGAGRMEIDRAEGDTVSLEMAGSGDLDIAQVTAKSVGISLAGSGDLTIKGGKADMADVSLAGSGDIDASGLSVATAEVSLAGSGDVNLTATSTAKVSLAGSGDVRVGGGAKCDSSEIGSGKVSCS